MISKFFHSNNKIKQLMERENENFVSINTVIEKDGKDQFVQVTPDVDSKYNQTKIKTYTKAIETISTKTVSVAVNCKLVPDSVPNVESQHKDCLNDSVNSISSSNLNSSTSYAVSDDSSSGSSEAKLEMKLLKANVFNNYTKLVIEDNPLLFIGIPKDCMYLIEIIQTETTFSIRDIYLVLKKIRMNLSFGALAYEFGVTDSQLSRIFSNSIHTIAQYLKQLITWPSKQQILLNLPMQFRYRYSKVNHIIDCFEIEIEKPSNALYQALTWSDYKKCNTAKYLVAVTPDGLATFISTGACGRSTDMAIVENSGYLDCIPSNVCILADRGFKQLDVLLKRKGCTLTRPPSVTQDVRSPAQEVKLTKQIASIRIHVERSINRIRDFKLLDIHARVDNHFLHCLDSAVIIGWSLINLQSPIIQQL